MILSKLLEKITCEYNIYNSNNILIYSSIYDYKRDLDPYIGWEVSTITTLDGIIIIKIK